MKHYDAFRFLKVAATVFVLGCFWWLSVSCVSYESVPKENANVTQTPPADDGRKYYSLGPFSEVLAAVILNGEWFYIDRKGNRVVL